MKLLFDQGTPVPLRKYLLNHTVVTAYEQGWNDIRNGDLLQRAETADFDAIITTDQNIRYQQNLTGRKISIVVLLTTKSEQTRLRHFFQNRMNKIFGSLGIAVECPNILGAMNRDHPIEYSHVYSD